MLGTNGRLLLGGLTGVVGLVAMVRLVGGAFGGHLSTFAWVFLLLAMIPWVGYCGWRAQHGRVAGGAGLSAVAFVVLGLALVWWGTLGAVLALACSLTAFVIIWVHDWPPRRVRGEDQFVRIEELATDEQD
jgi:hypothetical protein